MTEMDRRLQHAGMDIRNRTGGGIEQKTSSQMTPPSSCDSVPRSAHRRLNFESDDDDLRLIDEHIRSVSEKEVKRIKMEEERIKYQREANISMNKRFEQERKFYERRLLLEEKRFEMSELR